MTRLLERAVKKLKALPSGEQDAIAALILDELEDEKRWDKAFAASRGALAKLAAEAGGEYRAKKTKPLDPDKL
jgi:hypothetical protein